MFDDFIKSNWRSSWILNKSIEWQFLDEYTFFSIGDIEMRAVGVVVEGEMSYAASIRIVQNKKGKYDKATLSYSFKDVNIESIVLKKLDRLEDSKRDF